MKKSRLIVMLSVMAFGFISLPIPAALLGNNGGLIYDNVLDITWAQPDNVFRNFVAANSWAAGLTLDGATEWRLPYVSVAAGAGPATSSPVLCMTVTELACRDNELGYMFYYNLSGAFNNPILGSGDPDLLKFPNLQSTSYWSGTAANSGDVFGYQFDKGSPFIGNPLGPRLSWAVSDGDVRQGMTQLNPFLPDPDSVGGGTWSFTDAGSGNWFDPPTAGGYTYTMDGTSLFTDILGFPTGFNSPFEVLVGGISQGSFSPGQQVDFGAGVASFTIQGIDPGVDPDNPSAFPLQLEFSNLTASFTMSAIVPIPAAVWLFGSGLLGLIGIARRKKAA